MGTFIAIRQCPCPPAPQPACRPPTISAGQLSSIENAGALYHEPGLDFIQHAHAVADVGVQLREAETRGLIELEALAVEGRGAYHDFVGKNGSKRTLKPDLYAITASDDFEHHWLIEADRAREHTPHLLRKLTAYADYFKTGRYQATHGLFPTVLWVVPDSGRIAQLTDIVRSAQLPHQLFSFCTFADFLSFVITKTVGAESVPLPGIFEAVTRPVVNPAG